MWPSPPAVGGVIPCSPGLPGLARSGFPHPLARLAVVHPPPARRCPGREGRYAALLALVEKEQQVLSDLEREQVRLLDPGSGQVGDTVVTI